MLHTLTGTLLEVHRYVNAHHYHQRPSGPSDRYEIWLRDPLGMQVPFTINTRIFPARRGHYITLIVQTQGNAVIVRGLYNRTIGHSVNYLECDPPFALHVYDFLIVWPLILFSCAWVWAEAGLAVGVPLGVVYLLLIWIYRRGCRMVLSKQVDWALAKAIQLCTNTSPR